MKRIIIYFLFILMISLYGCTKTVQNVSKMNNKNVYNEMSTPYIDAISTLSEEDSNQESDIINEESIDIVMEYMTFDSAIKMPYIPMNTIAYGEEFINSMKSNPIDEAFYKEFEESSGSAADLAKILDKYLYYWEKEIEITKEALDVRLNDYYVKRLTNLQRIF
ncbi:MAG: hypothetical protein A2Y15_06255 [Clostridiales bacterium GWF2_36_10]|nr:MAG: hypothetical protein A2Y15_06255 [Clostridiales bacterium GWF2_36_10]HAN21881.1 hypothetical protein [Clostridiales bacterium]